MGKSFLFECAKCGYRTVAAGGPSEGCDLKVQTIVCLDCRRVSDCVTAMRVAGSTRRWRPLTGIPDELAPGIDAALARLQLSPSEGCFWQEFHPVCPRDPTHRIDVWVAPGRCPRCKAFMEGGGVPYRVWD